MTSPDAQAPAAELLAFMQRPDATDAEFGALALRIYARQFQHNTAFQRYCVQQGRTPRTVRHWHDIPAVPIDGFKDLTLSCIPVEQCERVFMTSGTTRADARGRHFHPDLRVYDASMTLNFAQRFMRGDPTLRMAVLFPTEAMMPNSSLAHYLALGLAHFGAPGSRYVIGPDGLDLDGLDAMLDEACAAGEPFALLGASYGFVHAMDALRERGRRYVLPAGSRILDTGGFKGQSREMPAEAFYRALGDTFGVAADDCINMYGMTELSTQFYDAGNASQPAVKSGPHWIRSRIVDPVTGRDVAAGERGILAHTDLANLNSVVTILTEDVGVAVEGGFQLLGRAQGAQAKGCSLAMDAFLAAARA